MQACYMSGALGNSTNTKPPFFYENVAMTYRCTIGIHRCSKNTNKSNPFKLNELFYISKTCLLILEVLGGIFHFYSNSNRTFCEQTVENLIRRRVL